MVFCHSELDRWNFPERLMGSFVVIALSPFLGHAPDLIERVGHSNPVSPYDKSILRWFAGLNELQYDAPRRFAHSASNRLTNSGPLSIRSRFGLPRISISSSSALTIRAAD
jgi:hypothetical protein